MASITSKVYSVYGKMQSFAPRSKQWAASSGTSGPSAGPAGSSGGASGGPFVTFRVTAKGMQADETLFMVGDDDELGAWNPLQGKKLCKDGETWTIRRPLKRRMSLNYKFVSVSKDTGGKRDFFVRWENGDDRVFKKQSGGHGPPTYSFDLPEITGFGERQRVTLPATQACQREMEDSALGPEPEPSRGTSQEKETTSAFEGAGAHDWLCQDYSGDSKPCEGQEQKAEKLNTFVSLESKVDDVIDSKPLQAESVGVDLRAQEWLQDSVPSRTQHVSQDRFSGLCQKVEVAEAFLPTEFTGAGKVETLETDTGLQEKLLERIAKLETDAAVQAESVAELQAKIEGLVQMEGNRYLKDTLCQKQQELEHAVNCVEKKIEHIPTMISDFETRFEQLESDVASQKDHLATLISHSGERFQEVESVMAHKNECDALISDCHTWFREVENAHKNDLVALVSQFDIKFKQVESAMASDKNDLAALISDSGAKFEKVESSLASQRNDLATLTCGTRAKFDRVESALACQKTNLATLTSCTRSRLEKVESTAASDKNDLVALISDSGTRVEKVESAVAAQKKDLAAIVSDSGAKFEKVESALACHKADLATLTSGTRSTFEKVESAVAAQKKDLAAIVSDSGAKFEKVESAMASDKNDLVALISDSGTRVEKVESAVAAQKKDLAAIVSDSGAKFEKVESALACQKADLATLTSGTRSTFEKVESAVAAQKKDLAAIESDSGAKFEKVESALACQKTNLATLTSGTRSRLEKVESAAASDKNDLVALISDSGTRVEKVESAVASHWADIAFQKKTLSGLQRQINDLDLKIPEADDTPLRLDSEAQKEMQRTQQQLKDLESQVAALSESVQRMSENSTSASKLKLPSSIAAPPLHPTKVELQPARAQPTFVQNEDLDEWNDVGLQRSDLEANSKNVEQPQSNTRGWSKPDDLKATGKSAFCGFQVPPEPEDEAIAKVCLEVEEKLIAAVRQNDPLDARKSLLRKVLLRLHSDKTGAPSAGMIWIEAWKNTHIEWYYNPHPVPEDQQKYMRK